MDDDQQQMCVMPDPPASSDPPASAAPADAPAPAPGPAPGAGDNPVLATVPPADQCDSLHPGNCVPDVPAPSPPNPEADAGKSLAWDLIGLIPGGSAVATGVDLVKAAGAAISGDGEGVKHDLSDAGLDALGMIPGVGTALSVEGAYWDFGSMVARGNGSKPDDAPTFSEAFYKGLPSWKDITSPFTDPDSWTPKGPAQ